MDFDKIKEGDAVSRPYTVDEKVCEGFLDIFGDHNLLHTDDAYACSKGFKGRVVHGAVLNGFISHFIGMVFPRGAVIIHSVRMTYKNPTYPGDRLEVTATVEQKVEAVRTLVLTVELLNTTQQYLAARAQIQAGIL